MVGAASYPEWIESETWHLGEAIVQASDFPLGIGCAIVLAVVVGLLSPAIGARAVTVLVRPPGAACPLSARFFEPSWWRSRNAITGTARGRGTVHFVQRTDARWALRHYWRGGWMARLSRDRYLWTGTERSRPWRELHLLAELHAAGLPVPRPIGARVVRSRFSYSGDIITECIEESRSLDSLLRVEPLPAGEWTAIGALLRRFHGHRLRHDDMNAGNILRDGNGAFYLIDFDKACLARPGAWRERNLLRLRRSLAKCVRRYPTFHFSAPDWDALVAGYRPPVCAGAAEEAAALPLVGGVAAEERAQVV